LSSGDEPVHPEAYIVLSRALVRFAFMSAPEALSRREADRAAILFAEAHAPHAPADWLIVRSPRGYGVWWWDPARVTNLAPEGWRYDRRRVAPETTLQPAGEGLRQAACIDGFEAQAWTDGSLVQSVWRRRAFTTDQWDQFVNALEAIAPDASIRLPPPEHLDDLPLDAAWRQKRVDLLPVMQRVETRIWQATAAVGLAAVGLLGTAGHAEWDRASAAKRLAVLESAQDDVAPTQRARADLETLQMLDGLQDSPSPVIALAELHRVAARTRASPAGWAINTDEMRVELSLGEAASVETVAAEFEESVWFTDVAPQLASERRTVVLSARLTNPSNNQAQAGRQ